MKKKYSALNEQTSAETVVANTLIVKAITKNALWGCLGPQTWFMYDVLP